MKNFFSIVIIVSTFFVAGCGKSETDSICDRFDPCAVKAPQAEIDAVKNYLTAQGITATQHCSGVFYVVDSLGTGATPGICNTVIANYQGTFTSGVQFDATTGTPARFSLSQVIAGWQAGVPLIKAGGGIRLYIPPSLGYGSTDRRDAMGNVVIPANSILIFRIQLLGVN